MKADGRNDLDENSLARGVGALVDRAKAGRLVSYRVAGVVLAVALVGGAWWYAARASRKATSAMWTAFDRTGSAQADLQSFADANKDELAGKVARLEAARNLLGPQGIGQLSQRDKDQRAKGIENVEAARRELLDLADGFKTDLTLRASCLLSAAEAELALAGVPKGASTTEYRGSAKAAADLLRQVAGLVGESTPVGEQAAKRAAELEAKAAQVTQVGDRLNTLISPPPSFTLPTTSGGPPIPGPKPPEGPVPAPEPAPTPPPAEGPKPPAAPVSPPAGGTPPPAAAPETTPPAGTTPTKK